MIGVDLTYVVISLTALIALLVYLSSKRKAGKTLADVIGELSKVGLKVTVYVVPKEAETKPTAMMDAIYRDPVEEAAAKRVLRNPTKED